LEDVNLEDLDVAEQFDKKDDQWELERLKALSSTTSLQFI